MVAKNLSSCLTLKQKQDIINAKRTKQTSNTQLAKQFCVNRTTIHRVLKVETKITNNLQNFSNLVNLSKYNYVQNKSIINVEVMLYEWFIYFRRLNLIITDELLQTKGREIFDKLKKTNSDDTLPDSFLFSNGWLHLFKKRFDIHQKRICGEGASVDIKLIEDERLKLQQLLKCYNKDDILNADELGLFYCLRPNYTLAAKNEDTTGITKCKLRVTTVLCCNASGNYKHTPLIIGKAATPRSFLTKREMNELNITYDNSTNAWMTTTIWINWIIHLDSCLTRKTLLLIDNCSAHKSIDYESLKLTYLNVHFLPPNTTSHLQPCDAGIIQNFKVNYRKLLLKSIIDVYENNKEDKTTPFSDVLKFISQAWHAVTPETINNCWHHTKILIDSKKLPDESESNNMKELEQNLKRLNTINASCDMTVTDFVNVDKNVNRLQNQESYIDVLINDFKRKSITKLQKDEIMRQLVNNLDNEQKFHEIVINAQQQNNDSLINIFYNICKSAADHKLLQ